jgi:anti-anti-sigma factor
MLHIEIEKVGDAVILHVAGSLVLQTIADAEETWRNALDIGPELIGLDFRNLSQIDSISINHLFKLVRAANDRGIRLVIYDVNEELLEILKVIRLDTIIAIVTKNKFETDYLKDI